MAEKPQGQPRPQPAQPPKATPTPKVNPVFEKKGGKQPGEKRG